MEINKALDAFIEIINTKAKASLQPKDLAIGLQKMAKNIVTSLTSEFVDPSTSIKSSSSTKSNVSNEMVSLGISQKRQGLSTQVKKPAKGETKSLNVNVTHKKAFDVPLFRRGIKSNSNKDFITPTAAKDPISLDVFKAWMNGRARQSTSDLVINQSLLNSDGNADSP